MEDLKAFYDKDSMDKHASATKEIMSLYPNLLDFDKEVDFVYSPIRIKFKEGINDDRKKAIMDILTKHYSER